MCPSEPSVPCLGLALAPEACIGVALAILWIRFLLKLRYLGSMGRAPLAPRLLAVLSSFPLQAVVISVWFDLRGSYLAEGLGGVSRATPFVLGDGPAVLGPVLLGISVFSAMLVVSGKSGEGNKTQDHGPHRSEKDPGSPR